MQIIIATIGWRLLLRIGGFLLSFDVHRLHNCALKLKKNCKKVPGIEVEEDVAATAWPQGVSKLKKTKSCLQAEEGSLRAGNGEETGKK